MLPRGERRPAPLFPHRLLLDQQPRGERLLQDVQHHGPARPQDGRCVRNRPDGAQDALGGQRRRGPVQRGGGEAPGQDVVQPDLDGLAQAFREGDEIRHGLHGKDGAGPVRSLGGPGGRTPCQVHRRQREAAGRGGQIQALRVLREAAREGRMAGLHRTLERNCCPRGRRCFEG